jgi:diacylglycerol kinase (ATP)
MVQSQVVEPNSQVIRRARLIMNPLSGDEEPNLMKLPDIIAMLESAGIRADLTFTKAEESPTEIAKRAVEEGYDMVIVGGGDGTVSEVAKGLLHAPIPLGILPIGTYNNIARSLNLPTEVTEACEVLAQGQVRRIDVGVANDKHYFFEAAGIGLDAVLFPLGEEIKGGRWGRMVQVFQLAMGYQPQKLQIQFDRPISEARTQVLVKRRFSRYRARARSELRLSVLMVVVANGPYYGTGFTVAPAAMIDDGLLTVNIFRNFSKWELVRHFWSISRGQYHYSPKIETYRAREVRVTSKANLPVHIDGHPIGEVPVTLKALQQALSVIVPTETTPTYEREADPNPPIVLPVAKADEPQHESPDGSAA